MKVLLVGLFVVGNLILIFSTPASASDLWLRCQKDSDCIKAKSHCGRQAAVNKRFREEQEEQVRKTAPLIQCLEPTEEDLQKDREARAVCRKETCVLEAPKAGR